jgi:hypothetical protein
MPSLGGDGGCREAEFAQDVIGEFVGAAGGPQGFGGDADACAFLDAGAQFRCHEGVQAAVFELPVGVEGGGVDAEDGCGLASDEPVVMSRLAAGAAAASSAVMPACSAVSRALYGLAVPSPARKVERMVVPNSLSQVGSPAGM